MNNVSAVQDEGPGIQYGQSGENFDLWTANALNRTIEIGVKKQFLTVLSHPGKCTERRVRRNALVATV